MTGICAASGEQRGPCGAPLNGGGVGFVSEFFGEHFAGAAFGFGGGDSVFFEEVFDVALDGVEIDTQGGGELGVGEAF